MVRRLPWLMAASLALAPTAPAWADKVVTTDGTAIEGEVLFESPTSVMIRDRVTGTVQPYFRDEITSLQKDPPSEPAPTYRTRAVRRVEPRRVLDPRPTAAVAAPPSAVRPSARPAAPAATPAPNPVAKVPAVATRAPNPDAKATAVAPPAPAAIAPAATPASVAAPVSPATSAAPPAPEPAAAPEPTAPPTGSEAAPPPAAAGTDTPAPEATAPTPVASPAAQPTPHPFFAQETNLRLAVASVTARNATAAIKTAANESQSVKVPAGVAPGLYLDYKAVIADMIGISVGAGVVRTLGQVKGQMQTLDASGSTVVDDNADPQMEETSGTTMLFDFPLGVEVRFMGAHVGGGASLLLGSDLAGPVSPRVQPFAALGYDYRFDFGLKVGAEGRVGFVNGSYMGGTLDAGWAF